MFKRIGVVLLAATIWSFCLELGEQFAIPGLPSFVSTAEAVVGRPLTPMSAAGVARRTSRRCAAGPYC
jgi:hypothetical protein